MKALVLNSGGVDSTTCVALAIEKYGKENVVTATLYYGQRHDKELLCAKKVAEHYGVRHIEEDISCVMKYAGDVCSLMKDSKTEIPDKSYAEQIAENGEGRVGTYVPFRNGLLLSIATAYADSLFPNQDAVVVYGAHADDAAGQAYADCSPEFADAMDKAISLGTYGRIHVWRPLINLNKAGVVAEGLRLKVPYELTWSCYKGGEKACGTCGTCIAEGTPVIMADGTQKAIETLKPGDMVWSMDEETGRARASKVLNVVCQGEKPVHTIGGIRMTDDHRVYVRSAGGVPSFREVSTLKRADAEYFGYVFPKEFLFEEDGEQFALGYLRGFVEGDGHIGERGVFTCQDSKDVLDEFWALYDKYVAPTKCNVHWDPKREIFIGSGGYGPVFAEKTAYSDNPSYLRGYLNGMLIAEGCGAYNPSNKSFAYVLSQSTSANPEKCEMIDKAFAAYEMEATVWEDKSFGFKEGGSAMRHWRFTQPWRVALRYGASKRADLFARIFEKGVPMRMDQITLEHYPNISGSATVWDIETEGHTFFAGALLVHNCIDRKAAFEANGVKDPIDYE